MIDNKHFYIDDSQGHAVLFGYVMALTKTEFRILSRIYKSEGYISADTLQVEILDGKNITLGNIAVHICNVNKKAKKICGKPIIKTCRFKGYKLVETI